MSRDAAVGNQVDQFFGAVIDDGQHLQASTGAQGIEDKVHRPDGITLLGQRQWLARDCHALTPLAPAHGQVGFSIEPVGAFVVDLRAFAPQQRVDPPITEAAPLLGQFDDPILQHCVVGGIRLF